ncbi:thioesterase family protein [Maribacter sp.]|uniref:thioesterase family protein n=1 Tax=Maribacter sp. TaxID=1897614 RepID=UPI0034501535
MTMYSEVYKVNGQDDIDDYMVMANSTYLKYSDLIRTKYFSNNIKNLLKIKEQSSISFIIVEQFVYKKIDLFFTNLFTVDIQILNLDLNNYQITTKHDFFNKNKQLCATTKCNLIWSLACDSLTHKLE